MYGNTPQVYDQSQTALYSQPQPVYGQPMMQPVMQPVMQPMYMQQAPTYQQGPTIITIDNRKSEGVYCQTCQHETG